MRSFAIVGVISAAILPSQVLGAALQRFPQVCSATAVLEYFTCQTVSQECYENVAQQANDWCIDYLSIEPVTTYATTIYDIAIQTVAETTTVPLTTTELVATMTVTGVTVTTTTTQTLWQTQTVISTITSS